MKNKQNIQRSDLDWWAFRYVAGELNETESEQFEARLDQDQGRGKPSPPPSNWCRRSPRRNTWVK